MKRELLDEVIKDVQVSKPKISKIDLIREVARKLKVTTNTIDRYFNDHQIEVNTVKIFSKTPRGIQLSAYVDDLRNNGVIDRTDIINKMSVDFGISPATASNYLINDGIKCGRRVDSENIEIIEKRTIQSCLPPNFVYQGKISVKVDDDSNNDIDIHMLVDSKKRLIVQKNTLAEIMEYCWKNYKRPKIMG